MHNNVEEILLHYDETLKEYREKIQSRFKAADFEEYSEILFSAHSCAIEGNSFSVNDTRELKEKGIFLKLHNKTLLEAYEILDHFKAYEYLMGNLDKILSEELLIETHRLLTLNTIRFTKGYEPGTYTDTQMGAGDTIFTDHKISIAQIPELLKATQKAIDDNKSHPLDISARFHYYFIYLHPFPDGNGRIGRLFSNFILAKLGHPNVIIPGDQKDNYIAALKATKKHDDPTILTNFFAKTAIERMQTEMKQKSQVPKGGKKDSNLLFTF